MPKTPQEHLIMQNWNLNIASLAQESHNPSTHKASPLCWSPPHPPSFKLNFDGAAKGNPGMAAYGGIFRTSEGSPLHIHHGSIGRDPNNAAELEGLWTGLSIAENQNFFPLDIEGDSQILIEATIIIQSGTSAAKIASSWRLLGRLEQIEDWLKTPRSINFRHVRRTANKVADRLANQGVNQQIPFYSGPLNSSNDLQLQRYCTLLVQHDLSIPDAGVRDRA